MIHEENSKEINVEAVSLYVIQISPDLYKL